MNGVDSSLLDFLKNNRNGISNPVVLNVLDTHQKVSGLRNQNSDRVNLLRQAAGFLSTSLDTSKKASFSLTDYNKVKNGLPLLHVYLEYRWRQTPLGNSHIVQYINSIAL